MPAELCEQIDEASRVTQLSKADVHAAGAENRVPEFVERIQPREPKWLEQELLRSVGKAATPLTAGDWEGIRQRGLSGLLKRRSAVRRVVKNPDALIDLEEIFKK